MSAEVIVLGGRIYLDLTEDCPLEMCLLSRHARMLLSGSQVPAGGGAGGGAGFPLRACGNDSATKAEQLQA